MFIHFPASLGFVVDPTAILVATTSSLLQFRPDMHHTHAPSTRMTARWPNSGSKDLAGLHYSLGLLLAGADLHNDIFSSACVFLKQFKDTGQHLKAQFQNSSKRPQIVSSLNTIHAGQKGIELPRNWSCFLLALGSWFPWLTSKGSNQNIQAQKGVTMASFYDGRSTASSGGRPSNPRFWTNVLIGLNILMFVAQEVSHGKLLLWGAKVNSLIDQGQFWRLVTPAILHANMGHLLINCYSLNSIGPVVEALGGPKRFIAVYTASAVTGVTTSYFFSRANAVGASGAIFGLAGSLAVFLLRHRKLFKGGQESLSQIARVITLNMVLGLVSYNIDNWGHLGGLVGGAFFSWLLGPALSFESPPGGGRKVLVDRPPVTFLRQRGARIGS